MRRLICLAPLILAACASSAIGPSLAKRPVERRGVAEPARDIPPPAPAAPELQAQIEGLVERAQSGQRDFAALLPRAEAAAAAAGSEGGESWIAAQQLLSALEGARAPSTRSLGELDALIATRLHGGVEVGLAELQAALTSVAALVAAQQREMDAIRARITR